MKYLQNNYVVFVRKISYISCEQSEMMEFIFIADIYFKNHLIRVQRIVSSLDFRILTVIAEI